MPDLTMGANAPITEDRGDLVLEWPGAAGSLDCSAFLLGPDGKVRSDDDMIFYNQRKGGDGAVCLTSGNADDHARFAFDLRLVPSDVERIMVCATVDSGGLTMGAFHGLVASFGSTAAIRFAPDLRAAEEVALRVVEVYRRGGGWKLRADGQGYNAGLGPLAKSFGVDVEGSEVTEAAPVSPLPLHDDGPDRQRVERIVEDERTIIFDVPSLDFADVPQPVSRPSGTIVLKRGGMRMLTLPDEKPDGSVSAALSWSSRQGGAEGRARPLRLRLGTFYETRNGRRGALQEPDVRQAPPGDDLLKLVPVDQGEGGRSTIVVNADRLSEIVLLHFYVVLDGAPSWRSSNVELLVTIPGNEPVAIEVQQEDDGCSCILMATLRADGGRLELQHLARSAIDQRALDAELDWRLKWRSPDPS